MTDVADEHRNADRIAGGALILGALLSVFAMAHHPRACRSGGLVGIVHGAMIVLMSVTAFGFAHFALRRGVARPAILAGLIAYFIGVVADLGAATTNGFVVPALAAHGAALSGRDVFLLAWEANQALGQARRVRDRGGLHLLVARLPPPPGPRAEGDRRPRPRSPASSPPSCSPPARPTCTSPAPSSSMPPSRPGA